MSHQDKKDAPPAKADGPKAEKGVAVIPKADSPKAEVFKVDAHKAEKPAAHAPAAKGQGKDKHTPAQEVGGAMYYVKSALAGGICCSITHGAVCPIGAPAVRRRSHSPGLM